MLSLLGGEVVIICLGKIIFGEQVKQARHYQVGTNLRFEMCMYVRIWTYVRHNSSAGTYENLTTIWYIKISQRSVAKLLYSSRQKYST